MRKPIKFGKYLLLERIAVGGMAEVFVAKAFGAEGFERLLAIKKILPTMGEDAEFNSMFVDEARIAAQLSHANIVQVLELGKHDDSLYIAMEYVSGRDLRQVIDRFRRLKAAIAVPQACLITAGVCEALDFAHRKRDAKGRPLGIVHRDVSPQNVLVSFEGEVKLIDFGIAMAESRLQKTQAGILKGKFSYMSPEQVKGLPVDGRSDIFAAGILLWELICGEKLFTGESDFAILEKVRSGIVPAPRSLSRACPAELEKVILKALAADPDERYQTASALHDDLMRFAAAGGTVYGPRQLARWLRDEFAADWENEQARLRGWLEVPDDLSVTPLDPFPVPVPLQATAPDPPGPLPSPPTPFAFDLSQERTGARRRLRSSPLVRPEREGAPAAGPVFRWALATGVLLLLAVVLFFWAVGPDRKLGQGKVAITVAPSVPAALFIDGKAAGTLPPFVRALAAGNHRLEVRADGYKPFATQVQVPSGGRPVGIEAQLVAEGPMQVEGMVLTQPKRGAAAARGR